MSRGRGDMARASMQMEVMALQKALNLKVSR